MERKVFFFFPFWFKNIYPMKKKRFVNFVSHHKRGRDGLSS